MRPARKLALSASLFRSAVAVSAQRTRHGPRCPSWSWTYEVLLAFLRTHQIPSKAPLAVLRQRMDAAGRLEQRRNRSHVVAAAHPQATWVTSTEVHAEGERVVFYLHGGAYGLGSVWSHLSLLVDLSAASRARMFALDYRLAPEAPAPAALEDAVAGYRALISEIDPTRIVIAGDSAGGGLALATLHALRDADLPLPAGAVLLSPWVDLTLSGTSYDTNQPFDFLPERPVLEKYAAAYAGALPRDDPRISPLFGDHTGLPPTYVLAGERELLVDENRDLVRALKAAGVDAIGEVEPDEVHVFPFFSRVSPRAWDAVLRLGRTIREFVPDR